MPNMFKCVYDISPLSTWSTWQTMMVYTTQIPRWIDKYSSFHFSCRKTKTENFFGFPVSVREVSLRTGNTAKLFYSCELNKSHHRVMEEEQCMLKDTFENHIVWPLAQKRAYIRLLRTYINSAEFWISSGTDIAQPHWVNCSNIWLPSPGNFFLIPTWKFYSCELSPWPLAHCAPPGRESGSVFTILFSHKNESWPLMSPPHKIFCFIATFLIAMVKSSFC